MNRAELGKEAKEKYHNHKIVDFQGFYNHHYYYLGYVESAEPREKRIAELEAQIEKMKKYIKACWVEENLNDYSSYITNTSDEFRDLVKELNEEIRNGR